MFYYIYKISDNLAEKLKKMDIGSLKNKNTKDIHFIDKFKIEEKHEWSSFNHWKIIGEILLKALNKKISFEIRLNSNFLLIISNNKGLKNKALEKLESFFNLEMNGELENFLPRVYNEYKLFCFVAEDRDLKFINNGEIIDSEVDEFIEQKYCRRDLSKDYRLIEADIVLNEDISFQYFRKSLLIPDEYDENFKEEILQTFEHAMI